MSKNISEEVDGGPAFPVSEMYPDGSTEHVSPGMSLRDYFAGQALAGLIASNDAGAGDRIEEVPGYAYAIADAMLQARKDRP